MILIFVFTVLSTIANADESPILTSPVFVKPGFSTVLEFASIPTQAVIGDANAFQVERLERSLVIKALVLEAQSNLLVYFQNGEPKSFIITASEKAEPTLYRKIGNKSIQRLVPSGKSIQAYKSSQILSASFDSKKDYLTVEYVLVSNSVSKATPLWSEIFLKFGTDRTMAHTTWSERKEVQRDTSVRGRVVFRTPDVPRNLIGVSLVLPMRDGLNPIEFKLGGRK